MIAGLLHAGAAPLLQSAPPPEEQEEGQGRQLQRAEWQERLLGSMAQCCALVRTLAAGAASSTEGEGEGEGGPAAAVGAEDNMIATAASATATKDEPAASVDLFCDRGKLEAMQNSSSGCL